jgi:hypothetical protein
VRTEKLLHTNINIEQKLGNGPRQILVINGSKDQIFKEYRRKNQKGEKNNLKVRQINK